MPEDAANTLTRGPVVVRWGAATDVGNVRKVNEDSLLTEPGIYVVADGMGGHQAGDVASRLTVEAVAQLFASGGNEMATLAAVVDRANAEVREHALRHRRDGMGSTLVGAFLVRNGDEESMVVVNVGDSRCYLWDGGELSQLTVDHSHVQELVDAGLITAEAAARHPERNVVTRAIGIEESVAGDVYVVPARTQTRLLLCSDGVSGELDADRIRTLLEEHDDPQDAADGLIAAVLAGRAADNASAIVVDITRLDLGEADGTTDPSATFDDAEITAPRGVLSPVPSPPPSESEAEPEAPSDSPSPVTAPSVMISSVPFATGTTDSDEDDVPGPDAPVLDMIDEVP